jgi:hypothetical protein
MIYLKAFLFGSIGLIVAVVLQVAERFVSAIWHSRTSPDLYVVLDSGMLSDKLFLLLAVVCIGLGVYVAIR